MYASQDTRLALVRPGKNPENNIRMCYCFFSGKLYLESKRHYEWFFPSKTRNCAMKNPWLHFIYATQLAFVFTKSKPSIDTCDEISCLTPFLRLKIHIKRPHNLVFESRNIFASQKSISCLV